MFNPPALRLIPYSPAYRAAVIHLLDHYDYLHLHLDWQDVISGLEALDCPAVLAWERRDLVGVMALSPPLAGTSWLRLVALGGGVPARRTMCAMWRALLPEVRAAGIREAGMLLTEYWPLDALEDLGFTFLEEVVTLERHGSAQKRIPPPLRDDLQLRPAQKSDLEALLALDRAAFESRWWMDAPSMRLALNMAASFTVAVLDGDLVGYELSTAHERSAHLVRLAAAPEAQGRGIGGALLGRMLAGFQAQDVYRVSVNTQESNLASQRLYRRFGFDYNGLNMPVWVLVLPPESG